MRVCVYTAITARHNTLRLHPPFPGVNFVAFLDEPTLVQATDGARGFEMATDQGWQCRLARKMPELTPRMWAKWYKVMGPFNDLSGYDWTVWIDGSYEITSDTFIEDIIAASPSGWGIHTHDDQDDIYQEARVSTMVPQKYGAEPIAAQVLAYRQMGFPEHSGLFGTGVMARRPTAEVFTVMRAWWDEMMQWTSQDQISLPFVVRQTGIRPDTFCWHKGPKQWLAIHWNPA